MTDAIAAAEARLAEAQAQVAALRSKLDGELAQSKLSAAEEGRLEAARRYPGRTSAASETTRHNDEATDTAGTRDAQSVTAEDGRRAAQARAGRR